MPATGELAIMAAANIAASIMSAGYTGKPKRDRSKNKAAKKARRKNRK